MLLRTIIIILFSIITIEFSAKITYSVPRVSNAPSIDGKIDEGEWSESSSVVLAYETNPGYNVPAPVKTIAYMMEDGEQIYFAFRAYDPEPEKILAFIQDRDGIFNDDFVGVILDTFDDGRRGFEFFVNPMGSQGDLTVDESNGYSEDSSWNTVWESAGQVSDEGYIVEMAIPYRALRYSTNISEQTWGIQFLRIYPRDSRTTIFDRTNNRELDCSLCQANKLKGIPNLKKTSTNIDITPTVTYLKNDTRDVEPISDWEEMNNEADFGVDFRWAMTEDWIVNATVNPDFSQVEADAGQLDINTTYSLFYPESRPFFLDGADYFSSMNRLVHTRNIADPDYGVKLSGKTNGYSLGVISATDASTSILIPSSQGSYIEELENQSSEVFVARGQSDIGDKNNVGVLVTSRSATDYKNQLVSVDGRYYFTKKDVISYQYMHSNTDNPDSIRFDEDDGEELLAAHQSDDALTLSYRHNEEDYLIRVDYNDFGKDFRADMGFIGQVDYTKLVIGGNYLWRGKEGAKWTKWGISGDWDKTEEQSGKLLEEETEIHFILNGPLQFMTNSAIVKSKIYHDGQYFDQEYFMIFAEFKPFQGVTIGNWMLRGDGIDYANTRAGDSEKYEPYFEIQIGKHFSVNLSYYSQRMEVLGEKVFKAALYDIRLAYQFNTRSRLSFTIQSTDINRNTALYEDNQDTDPDNDVYANEQNTGTELIYSYKINPQTLVYVGYSDNAIEHDNVQSLEKTDKTFFAKFSYLWQL